MPRDCAEQPPNRVRRADREITDEGWIRDFSHRARMAALAMASAEAQPLINSNLSAYDEPNSCINMHTAQGGRTRETTDNVNNSNVAICRRSSKT
jgi:nitroimidazol reductase NimA-like FMN-containing flavoprotein (pyridoxamine 5'-phosphate oxidase superfamily)